MSVQIVGTEPAKMAEAARRNIDMGAQIILGPLFGEAANAAGVAVADNGVNGGQAGALPRPSTN